MLRRVRGPAAVALVSLAWLAGLGAADPPADPPSGSRNVFENEFLTPHYPTWWRPEAVIFDEVAVPAIDEAIEAIPEEDAGTVDIREALGEHADSAFVFPLMAAYGEKGVVLLRRLLAEYADGHDLDNRWLLIVASLSRTGLASAEEVLRKELARVEETGIWLEKGPLARPGMPRRHNPRRALWDGIVACQAFGGRLSTASVEELDETVTPKTITGLVWMFALDWGKRLMPEEEFVDLMAGGLALSDATDLEREAAPESVSGRQGMIGKFCCRKGYGPRLAKALARHDAWADKAHADYSLVLVMQSFCSVVQQTGGRYPLDVETAKLLVESDLPHSRSLSMSAAVLLACEPLPERDGWREFLARHASALAPEDEEITEFVIGRVEAKKTEEPRPKWVGKERGPGVHIRGFGARL